MVDILKDTGMENTVELRTLLQDRDEWTVRCHVWRKLKEVDIRRLVVVSVPMTAVAWLPSHLYHSNKKTLTSAFLAEMSNTHLAPLREATLFFSIYYHWLVTLAFTTKQSRLTYVYGINRCRRERSISKHIWLIRSICMYSFINIIAWVKEMCLVP